MEHKYNPTHSWLRKTSSCIECGGDLPPYSRPDKLFCGDTCRKRHSRRRENVDAALTRIMSELQLVRLYLKKPVSNQEHVDQVNERLKRIRDEVTDILRLRDKETILEAGQRDELIAGMRK